MKSIRSKLLISLVLAVLIAFTLSAIAIYFQVKSEIVELYNDQANQVHLTQHHATHTLDETQMSLERNELIVEASLMAVAPLVFMIPFVVFVIGVIIQKGLLPLQEFQQKISMLDENALKPLVFSSLPLELKPLGDALNAMINRLNIALQARKNFVADAAHELRTPLAALLLQLELAKKAVDTQETQKALETLEKGILRANRLTEQLLMLARQEKRSDWVNEKADLTRVVSDVLVGLLPLAEAKKIELTVEHIEQARVIAHEYDIQTLVTNLLDNAIRYTLQGGTVLVGLYTLQDSIVLKIIDNGIGIKESSKERIFDRFYRVNNHNSIGSGLGLSIVKEICQKYDIKIILEDNMPTGTVVTLEFNKERLA